MNGLLGAIRRKMMARQGGAIRGNGYGLNICRKTTPKRNKNFGNLGFINNRGCINCGNITCDKLGILNNRCRRCTLRYRGTSTGGIPRNCRRWRDCCCSSCCCCYFRRNRGSKSCCCCCRCGCIFSRARKPGLPGGLRPPPRSATCRRMAAAAAAAACSSVPRKPRGEKRV